MATPKITKEILNDLNFINLSKHVTEIMEVKSFCKNWLPPYMEIIKFKQDIDYIKYEADWDLVSVFNNIINVDETLIIDLLCRSIPESETTVSDHIKHYRYRSDILLKSSSSDYLVDVDAINSAIEKIVETVEDFQKKTHKYFLEHFGFKKKMAIDEYVYNTGNSIIRLQQIENTSVYKVKEYSIEFAFYPRDSRKHISIYSSKSHKRVDMEETQHDRFIKEFQTKFYPEALV